MASTRSFSTMLNEFLPNKLLKEEMIKRDFFLQNVEKDDTWAGGQIIVPFKKNGASSVAFGGLTSSTDVAESSYIRGTISSYTEVWGTLILNHTDIMQHGKVDEQSLLRVLPDEVDGLMQYMKEVVSVQLQNGPHFATVVEEASSASGILGVDVISRFQVGQKVYLQDGDTAAAAYYVTAVDLNTVVSGYPGSGTVTVSATRGGAAANVSTYTIAQAAKFYHDGVTSAGGAFTSIREALLTSGNGGASTLHGQTKTASPILQAINIDGSTINATNILEKIFDAYTQVRAKGRGNADTVVMSYKHLGSVMKLIEVNKGPFKVSVNDRKASLYGWDEIEITSVRGKLKLVGVQEMLDSEIFVLDMSSMKFFSNGFFKKRMSPEGKEFFELRATTGYSYLIDICLFGALQHSKPSSNGIIYGITAY